MFRYTLIKLLVLTACIAILLAVWMERNRRKGLKYLRSRGAQAIHDSSNPVVNKYVEELTYAEWFVHSSRKFHWHDGVIPLSHSLRTFANGLKSQDSVHTVILDANAVDSDSIAALKTIPNLKLVIVSFDLDDQIPKSRLAKRINNAVTKTMWLRTTIEHVTSCTGYPISNESLQVFDTTNRLAKFAEQQYDQDSLETIH